MCLAFGAAYVIRRQQAARRHKLFQWFLIFLLFSLGTIRASCSTAITEMMFINNGDYPGGPVAFFIGHFDTVDMILSNTVFLMCDVLTCAIIVGLSFISCTLLCANADFSSYLGSSLLDHMQQKKFCPRYSRHLSVCRIWYANSKHYYRMYKSYTESIHPFV